MRYNQSMFYLLFYNNIANNNGYVLSLLANYCTNIKNVEILISWILVTR